MIGQSRQVMPHIKDSDMEELGEQVLGKLERLAELNALLNMDEKGDNALDMGDDEPEDEM